ncbi:hypothetical protein ACLOJK_037619 [Asimina triloba]
MTPDVDAQEYCQHPDLLRKRDYSIIGIVESRRSWRKNVVGDSRGQLGTHDVGDTGHQGHRTSRTLVLRNEVARGCLWSGNSGRRAVSQGISGRQGFSLAHFGISKLRDEVEDEISLVDGQGRRSSLRRATVRIFWTRFGIANRSSEMTNVVHSPAVWIAAEPDAFHQGYAVARYGIFIIERGREELTIARSNVFLIFEIETNFRGFERAKARLFLR